MGQVMGFRSVIKSQAEQYRANAADCFDRSRRAPDHDYQKSYYDLAIDWLAMAAEVDFKRIHQNTFVEERKSPHYLAAE
jgi:endo-1,4-beta-D-glucanase Y